MNSELLMIDRRRFGICILRRFFCFTNTLRIISDFDKNYSAYYWQFLRKILCVLLAILIKVTLRTIDFTEQTKPVHSLTL